MGKVEPVGFVSDEATLLRFQQEWVMVVKPLKGK